MGNMDNPENRGRCTHDSSKAGVPAREYSKAAGRRTARFQPCFRLARMLSNGSNDAKFDPAHCKYRTHMPEHFVCGASAQDELNKKG